MFFPFDTLPGSFQVQPFPPARNQTRPTPTTAQLERTLNETLSLVGKLIDRHCELLKRVERAEEERAARDFKLDGEFNTLQHTVDANTAAISIEQQARIYAIKDLQAQVDKLRAGQQTASGPMVKFLADDFSVVTNGNQIVDDHGMIQDTISLDTCSADSAITARVPDEEPTIEVMLQQLQRGADVLHKMVGAEDPDERIFDLANARWHMMQAVHLLQRVPNS